MFNKALLILAAGTLMYLAIVPRADSAVSLGTAITYQGQLKQGGIPSTGLYDFIFTPCDSPDGDDLPVADPIYKEDVEVENGLFSVSLDFGSGVFDGNALWLEIEVRPGQLTDPNEYSLLTPRQEVTPAPYAIYAQNVSSGGSGAGVPSGAIIMWSGSIASIPTGWALCDGSNGTPDLRDKFIVGAAQDDAGVPKTNVKGTLMQTGGEHEHTLTTSEMPNHDHQSISDISHIGFQGEGAWYCFHGGNQDTKVRRTSSEGGGQPHENCPPFYALAFIMKK